MEPRLAGVRHGRPPMLFDRHRSRLALLAEAAGRLVGAQDARQLVRDLFDLIAAKLRLDAVVNYDLVENAGDHGSWLQLVAYCGISDEQIGRAACRERVCQYG